LLEGRPSYAEGHYQCGVCLSHVGQFEEAFVHFSTSAELDASRADAPLGMGICLLSLKRPRKLWMLSARVWKNLQTSKPRSSAKAVALQLSWEMDEALEIYRAVLERNPRCEEALVNW